MIFLLYWIKQKFKTFPLQNWKRCIYSTY